MNITQITNTNMLQSAYEFKEYLDNEEQPPLDVFFIFISELEFSTLLIPGIVDDDKISFSALTTDEDEDYIPLFTSEYEYQKVFGENDDLSPVPIDMRECITFLETGDFEGVVIDAAGINFPIVSELIMELPLNQNIEGGEEYGPYELKEIADDAENVPLIEFIKNGDDYHEMMEILRDSCMLNLLVTEKDIEGFDGIISSENIDICSINDENGIFALLFTDKNAILNVTEFEDEFNYFYQLTSVPKFVDFVLRSDMEGIIINIGTDNCLIPREVLMMEYEFLITDNKFKNSMDFAFKF